MKIFKKIALSVAVCIVLLLLGGYLYFDKKFTPPENSLAVLGIAQNIEIRWDSAAGNSHAAVLLPVRLKGIHRTFYMQLDSGSPTTLFYKKSMESIQEKFRDQIKFNKQEKQISVQFSTGNMNIASDRFELLDYGSSINFHTAETNNIIGTIGTDLLEKRIIVLDFKNGVCSFIENTDEKDFEAFEFKKRKILLPSEVENQKLKLLYDSGTSGYELITNKEEWEKYRTSNGNIKKEKGNSWGNILTVISAPADRTIRIGSRGLKLSEVTYIEGTSKMQNLLMKSSGMQGMTGNKLFLNHKLILDCKNKKFKVE
ncbi:hypothetical protein [Chryseobacterium luteum]|uniref:Peptidase A2 domain-containing protein n=1 Tax=Chryseobacterium luteum TaxID=421531 RepID=A0A085YZI0_9FLAO|nr:hypothetical protein [Chryseobacterium luteum]KFE97593.1 hypothetical protein IX38_20180 [Chryseobacterium luteum]